MNHAPRICIAGAGAIGCTLAARLADTGHTVSVLARGATLAAIRANGIHLDDLDGHHFVRVPASDRATDLGPQDIVFLCAKADALPALAADIQPLLHAGSLLVPVVNGLPWWYFHGLQGRFAGQRIRAVDPEGLLAERLDLAQVIGCVVFITAQCPAPAVAEAQNPHLMIFGEPDNRLTPRLERLRALVADAGIEARASERIRDSVWTKAIANLSSNPLSVITGATLEQIYGQADLRRIAGDCLQETLLTAAAYGARIEFDPQTFLDLGAGMGAVRTSMLQDYDKGRPLELAAIGDAVLELADRLELPMPITRHLVALARFRAHPPRP
ncbi:ketopantoate reductase family protein [Metapseudomonas furukawaii]|uniref:2-dehydropantoate 2-reductase n=1 Tax=Metapseudomonas furukawaii TaxID=1149133 RepID=A0AAD1C334_METFU|nr:2-dehydropantoate 2-reductase [Pseudomonas furukawaii]ELS25997.1 2-dehydropantoate 2-reductase [Pseudomonas furukawaii]BAU75855.1 2-dehydropantoate 2-reductase [Pseudomonas furukawaii]